MDTRQLEAFVSVVSIGSFTRAAARMGLTQPTITNRIKSLEQQFGATLLHRLPGGIEMTMAGTELLPYARDIVALTARAREAVGSDGEPHGRVDVGTLESLTSHRLLPLVEYLYRRYPRVQLSMHATAGTDALADVRDHRLDCAFYVDAVQPRSDVTTKTLCPEPLVLVGGRGHALLGVSGVTEEQLCTTTLIRSEVNAHYHRRFEHIIDRTGGCGPRTFELDSLDATKRSVANGMGIALMPEVAVSDELDGGELFRIDWSPPFDTFTQIAWRPDNDGHSALKVLVAAAEQVVQEQLGQ